MNESTQSVHAALLPFLGVLRIGGVDAVRFLQGQLTNDVQLLADGRTQLAALNTPQGRVVALLRLRQHEGAIHALLPTELLEPVSDLLRRYVLRSRVQLQIASELQVGWITDAAVAQVVTFDYAPGRKVIAAPAEAWKSITSSAPMQARPGIETEWRAMDIAEGLPQIHGATSGAFVPQMLNLDLLDAISFSKGCYTGQEIVARTQHLGRIKRRLLRYRLPRGTAPAPLTGLFRDSTKVAEIVMSVALDSGVELLAVTSLDARDGPLRTEDGRDAQAVELPYPVAARD